MKRVIANAQVVSSKEVALKNVYIEDERFCPPFDDPDEVIDAKGLYLLPGAVDAHTHIEEFCNGADLADDFYAASAAAAKGGTTTLIDFVIQRKGVMPLDCLKKQKESAEKKSVVDFAFHLQFCDVNETTLAQLPAVIHDMGVTSVKVFMAFSRSGFKVSEPYFLELLKLSKKLGFVLSAHCENEELMNFYEERLIAEGKTGAQYYARSRPVFTEAESVARALCFAEEAGHKVYIVHLSSAAGLEKIKASGGRAIAETCIQYLTLDDSKFLEKDGFKNMMAPPLRSPENLPLMWEGVANGDIEVIATDHSPFLLKDKLGCKKFTDVPLGVPGIEYLLPVTYSEGVAKGHIPITKMVEVISENPAKIFGLARKGFIREGFDADYVLFDPNVSYVVAPENIACNSGYSLYEGMRLSGKPVVTAVRGQVVYKDDRLVQKAGYGKYIARTV